MGRKAFLLGFRAQGLRFRGVKFEGLNEQNYCQGDHKGLAQGHFLTTKGSFKGSS